MHAAIVSTATNMPSAQHTLRLELQLLIEQAFECM